MTQQEIVKQPQIDAQLKRVLSNADERGLPLAKETIDESADRWYGKLVVHTYDSLTDAQNVEAVLPAAAAIELLRGYARLRGQLLVQLTGTHTTSSTLDPTPALLAGDYLSTSAFSSLNASPQSTRRGCIEILTNVLETVTEAFTITYTPAATSKLDQTSFLDKTVGSIGKGATLLGATLAGVASTHRRDVASAGRGLSTARQIHRLLDADSIETIVDLPALDESRLRDHAEKRRNEADHALSALSEMADITSLRALAGRKNSW